MEKKIIDFSQRIFILTSILVFSLLIYIFGSLYSYPDFGSRMLEMETEGGENSVPEIKPGQQEINVEVMLTYEIE